MHFESRFNPGDKVFCITNSTVALLTVGKITIEHTESKGRGDPNEIFDNYKPQQRHDESYMCDETGIGSGYVYRLGSTIFATEAEAEAGLKKIEGA